MNPKADKLVRRTTMVATVTASYFLLTADYGPEPNALDPVPEPVAMLCCLVFIDKKRELYVSVWGIGDGGDEIGCITSLVPYGLGVFHIVTCSFSVFLSNDWPFTFYLVKFIKKAILSAQNSVKEFVLGPSKEHQETSLTSNNAKEHP
ncbi:hypothetical protein COLO4_12699 [Corchorus olitorius]|uniref:Uncharacterized protein n=1 Tax=Corchorus olitorius TaxID=93759 RepID=A0A1R3K035_9ROSI|nr:hypothetical protein COLO4_12699 [Corchorus olitorius]